MNFVINDTSVDPSSMVNSGKKSIFNSSKLRDLKLGSLDNVSTDDILIWDGTQWVNGSPVSDFKLKFDTHNALIARGVPSGVSTLTATGTVIIGWQAGQVSNTNPYSVEIGYNTGQLSSCNNSVGIGAFTLLNTNGSNKVAIGYQAGMTGVSGDNTIAIGDHVGFFRQQEHGISIGNFCGQTLQGTGSIAIGYQSGFNTQGTGSIAIGNQSGKSNQTSFCIAIGNLCGQSRQDNMSISIGDTTAKSQDDSSIAIGTDIATFGSKQQNTSIAIGRGNARNQQPLCVAIGRSAGLSNQSTLSVAIGYVAGNSGQGTNCLAIGVSAGGGNQGIESVCIGNNVNTDTNSVSIGKSIGLSSDVSSLNIVSMGYRAGSTGQGDGSVAIGYQSGIITQGSECVSVGYQSGMTSQGIKSVSIGNMSGSQLQGLECVAIGNMSGLTNQRTKSVSIGSNAGSYIQGTTSVAIGYSPGQTLQGTGSIAIGYQSGLVSQGTGCVAIGYQSGMTAQGKYSIAIGTLSGSASGTQQHANSIVLNALGTELSTSGQSRLYIAPIRLNEDNNSRVLCYNTTTKEVVFSTIKTFVIDHPSDKDRYLVHACLEGPEAGVYYRGEGHIDDSLSTIIDLPHYVEHISDSFTVNVSVIDNILFKKICTSRVKNNKFTVSSSGKCDFFWIVYGKRYSIDSEPLKESVVISGDGPYKYLSMSNV
jgi:hypothetical protein